MTAPTCPDCGCVLDDLTLLGEVLSEDEARSAHTCATTTGGDI